MKISDTEIETVAKNMVIQHETIRKAAKETEIAKSTLHYGLTKRLPRINPVLSGLIQHLFSQNTHGRYGQ